ncbi:hypothetical protein DERP_007302 [Dermatophagoides pteronyssinus]|uniref:PH domain-containing protein n=1 Tax=Dermatophagoides pteronyssinus TaxID=6956 RepID=A0ABQ8J431_DERPT|nr:hypothetical protein DERP_007302 [Dermatophagoides pteronyssinus]
MTINNTTALSSHSMKDNKDSSTTVTTLPKKSLDHYSISIVQECTAIKKGLLWEQQQQPKIFFFNRWKERFFILTQDYLTCFKKGSKKVGMSEMGSFVYKINLNEIQNLNWVDKKKNGVIGIQLSNTMIFLWNNSDSILDEWMSKLQDSTIRTKDRRTESSTKLRKSSTLLPNINDSPIVSQRLNQSSLIAKNDDDDNDNNNGFLNDNHMIIPPPPPPRRYLRCLSTGKLQQNLGNTTMNQQHSNVNKIVTPSLSRNSMAIHNSPISMINNHNNHNNNNKNGPKTIWTKMNLDIISNVKDSTMSTTTTTKMATRKQPSNDSNNSIGSSSSSSLMSQSLRCKSSYALQYSPLMININDSPTQTNHHQQQQQQRRICNAKRISTFQNNHNNNNSIQQYLMMNKNNHQTSNSSSSFFKSADSEFTFVNSKANEFKPENSIRSRNASLMLNNRRLKNRNFVLDQTTTTTTIPVSPVSTIQTPPPIPPHRTHLHNF